MALIINYEGSPAEQAFMRSRIQPANDDSDPRNRVLDKIVLGAFERFTGLPEVLVIVAPYRIPGLSNTLPGPFAILDTSHPDLIYPTGDHFGNERSVLLLEPLEDSIGLKFVPDEVRVYAADDQSALFSWGLSERRSGDSKVPFVVKLFYHPRGSRMPEFRQML